MYHGRQAAPAQAAGDSYAAGHPAPPGAGRRRIGLAPVPESARAAREFTAVTLRQWRLDVLTEDAVVIASELATNAIVHGTPAAEHGTAAAGVTAGETGGGRVELSLCLQASRLICMVTDQTGTPPALAAVDPEAESGHGLQIVGALAVAWGWTVLGTGEKAVWAALELPGAVSAAGSAPAETARAASPATVRDMRAAGPAAGPGRLDPAPAVR